MKKNLVLIFTISFFFSGYSLIQGQMFSVEDQSQNQRQNVFQNSYLRIGAGPASFKFTGSLLNSVGTENLEFDNTALNLIYESTDVSLSILLANKLMGLEDVGFFDLGFALTNGLQIVRRSRINAGIPIQFYSSITSVNNEKSQENFNQVNLAAGAGAFLNLRVTPKITFTNRFIPGYGFSNSSGGFLGGSMFYATGKSRLNFNELLLGRGLSIGYDFNYRSFDIDDEFYDFDLKSHLITIGVSF